MKQLLLSLFAFVYVAGAQVVPNHYIVELSNEPVARLAHRQHKRLESGDPAFAAHRATIREEQGRVRRRVESTGGQVLDSFETVHNALVVRMSREQAAATRSMAGVKSVRAVRMYHKLLDRSLALQKITDAWQQIGGVDKAGAGVKIAIIDTGIDITHPAFQDAGFTAPAGFPKTDRDSDSVYTNQKIIVARGYTDPDTRKVYSAKDIDGHGTGVAMVAAGGTNTGIHGPITGVAPKAWLGNYKVFPDGGNGAPDSLIIRAIEDAVNDGMDVINLSLGGFPATRPADDALVVAVENAAAAGKVVVVAAGNDGTDPNTIGSPGTAPSAIAVGSTMNDRIFAGHVIEDGHDPFTAFPGDGKNSDSKITAVVKDVSTLDPTALACDPLPAESMKGAIALILRGTCTFTTKLNNAQSAGAIAAVLYARAESPDPITMSTQGASLPAVMVSNADGNALRSDSANGNVSISLDFTPTAALVNSAHLSSYSSVGPNSDSGIKPDLLAVGENIYTAEPVSQGAYVVESGTSFSSPTVAGAAALLMAARPGLSGQQYRSLLINSATAFTVDGASNPLGVQAEGAGLLNMTAALANTTTVSPVSLSFGIGGKTIDATQKLTVVNTGAAPDVFSISAQGMGDGPVPALSDNSIQLAPGQSREIAVQFSARGLSGGVYQGVLQIQGTQSTVIGRVPYWYAVPTQSPKYFQLLDSPSTPVRRGATFDIEFRVLDANGVPVTEGIDTSLVSGAQALSIESSDSDIPGSFIAHVQAPSVRGTVNVNFTIGDVDTGGPVAIRVN